LVPDVKIITL